MAETTQTTLRNKVIYQIFTRNYKEGTFKAVEADLKRIKALGVDIIYLLPIQPSGEVHRKGSMGSPYAIKDYRAVDPVQGTMEDFIHLTEAIHEAGMDVMLDVVYNHTSPDSVLSVEHPEWFYKKADGSFGNRIGDWWDVIDLDYNQPGLWDYQIETLKMWAKYVDGFRCDVAPLLPLEFWKRARREVEEVRPGCLWLAEAVEPFFITENRKAGLDVLTDGELYQAFDICYDYDIYGYQSGCMLGENTLETYVDHVNWQEGSYPANYSKLRCLENHDRMRAAALVPDERALRNWTAWIYFMKGTTMIYAGQEFGVDHHPTLFDRDTVDFETGKNLSGLMAKLAQIKEADTFAKSTFSARVAGKNKDIIVAEHYVNQGEDAGHKTAVGIFGTEGKAGALTIDLPDGTYRNEISGESVDIFEKRMHFKGEPIILFL